MRLTWLRKLNSAYFRGFLDIDSHFMHSESIICRRIGGVMNPLEGRLIRLPQWQGAPSADAVFEDMLTGWKQQQLARNFTAGTIRGRESLVRRFVDHTGHFP